MSSTVCINLTEEYSVNIGGSYKVAFQLCNSPDLEEYVGHCQVRQSLTSEPILTPTINVINKDTFELVIGFGDFTGSIEAGVYLYDVLFAKSDHRFYAIGGKIQLVQRVTRI